MQIKGMKAQDILNKIKEVVGIELSEEVAIQLEEIKLENGTVLVSEAFEEGQSVFIKTEDEEIALPVGEYTLEDGRSLMVKEEGLIDKIMNKEEKEEVKASEETLESTEDVVESTEDVVEETALEEEKEDEEKEEMKYVTREEFAKAVEEIKLMIEKMGEGKKEDMSEVEEVEKEEMSAEAADPIKHNPEAESKSTGWFKSNYYPNTIQNRIYEQLNK